MESGSHAFQFAHILLKAHISEHNALKGGTLLCTLLGGRSENNISLDRWGGKEKDVSKYTKFPTELTV